jgi:uncharacterized repeat protein (TIGR03803 family)
MSAILLSGAQRKNVVRRRTPVFGCFVASLLLGVASYNPSGAATLKVLHEFSGPDGSDPSGGLVIDPNTGILYGTTKYGGTGSGTVFSLTPPAGSTGRWKFHTVYTFQGGDDGSQPESGLALASDATTVVLFGTTRSGSANCSCGTIFSLGRENGGPWLKKKLRDFSGDAFDGTIPNSTPVLDPSFEYLYGTTGSIGGSSGTIYYLNLETFDVTVIYNPGQNVGGNIGYHPQGVVLDGSTLYGTAFDGSEEGTQSGTIFQIGAAGGNATVLHGFGLSDGAGPLAPPVLGPDGSLYGTTVNGGKSTDCPNSPGCGVVWKRSAGGRFKILHSFAFFRRPKDGMSPMSPLVLDATSLTSYGTTYYGGTGTNCGGVNGSCGTVFASDTSGNYQVLWDFPRGGPANPMGQLVFYAGDVYGTSYDGGKPCPDQHYIGCGTVWKLTP